MLLDLSYSNHLAILFWEETRFEVMKLHYTFLRTLQGLLHIYNCSNGKLDIVYS